MYRLLFCLLLIQVAVARRSWCGRHPSSCRHFSHRHHICDKPLRDIQKRFDDLSKDIVRLDKKLQKTCDSNNTREILTPDTYIINVQLPDFGLEHISVQLRHRLLHIQAYKSGENSKLFSELKILPSFLELSDATYKFADGVLQVIIPVKVDKNQSDDVCRRHFDESVVTIPNIDTKNKIDIDDDNKTIMPIVEKLF